MRKIIAFVAGIVVLIVGFVFATLSTNSGTLLSTIYSRIVEGDPWITNLAIAGGIACIILFWQATRKVRIVVQEQTLENIDRYLRDIMPTVERLERYHPKALRIKAQIVELEPRVAALVSANTGIAATIRQIADIQRDTQSRLDEVATDGDGNDVSELSDDLSARIIETDKRISGLEHAFAQMPELRDKVTNFTGRIEDLEEKRDQALEDVSSIYTDLDDVLSADRDAGRLYDLEGGDSDHDSIGDLDDQVDDIAERVKTINERLEKLKTHTTRIPELLTLVTVIKDQVEALEDSDTGLIGQLEALFEVIDKLLDSNGEGIVADLEAGSTTYDGDLADQVSEFKDRITEINDRLRGIRNNINNVDRIREQFTAMGNAFSK